MQKNYQNLTEMLWSEETERLLRLCGAEERWIDARASDYERLRALAEAMPLLAGHPITARVAALLAECFSITQPLTPDTLDEIWRTTADSLLLKPIDTSDFDVTHITAEPMPIPTQLQETIKQTDAFSALLFARTKAKSLDGWMREIESVMHDVVRSGCKTLFFGLPEAFADRKPSIYHVDMTLHRGVQGKGDLDLLYAQLMRILAQICQEHDLTLMLRVETAPSEVINLLSRVEREVGLPRMIWSTPRTDTRAEMLNFSAKPHQNALRAAVSRTDYPTAQAFSDALAEWATLYPIGRLIEIGE